MVKDEAYGHGAMEVAQIALEEGAAGFGLSTLEEAMTLRDAGIPRRCCCWANGRSGIALVRGARPDGVCQSAAHHPPIGPRRRRRRQVRAGAS